MALLPYIANKRVRFFGIMLFVGGLLTLMLLGGISHLSGEVVAESDMTQPLPQAPLAEQMLQATSQSLLQNTMNKMGVPAYRTDDVEHLNFEFNPVYLTPEMGKVTFLLEIKVRGIIAHSTHSWVDQDFKTARYIVKDVEKHQVVYDETIKRGLTNPDERNHQGTIVLNGRDTKVGSQSSLQFRKITSLSVPHISKYTVQANIEKLKFAYPIESIKLIVKKDMIELSQKFIFLLIGIVACGILLCIMTIPPEMRKQSRKNRRYS